MNKRNIDFSVRRTVAPIQKKAEIISVLPLKSDRYYYVDDICTILGIGRSLAYRIIAKLHAAQPDHGADEPPGCISKVYFMEQLYGAAPRKENAI